MEGVEITGKKVDINKHRQKMGMVFQLFNVFPHLTVKENVTMAPVLLKKKTRQEADEMAMSLLARVGLAEKAGEHPGLGAHYDPKIAAEVKSLREKAPTQALNGFVMPLYTGDAFSPGSTDVGDVSWLTPTAQIYTACFPSGAPGHSWQNVSIGKTSVGHKGLLLAGKVLAMTAADLFEHPEIIDQAKKEFAQRAAEGYTCPIPDDAVPIAIAL